MASPTIPSTSRLPNGRPRARPIILVAGYKSTASAAGRMTRSGDLDLRHNAVHVVMVGTLGSGDLLFPSAIRQVETAPSQLVGMDQQLPPSEKNDPDNTI